MEIPVTLTLHELSLILGALRTAIFVSETSSGYLADPVLKARNKESVAYYTALFDKLHSHLPD